MTKLFSYLLLLMIPFALVQPAHGNELLFRHTDLGDVGLSGYWSKARLQQGRMRVTLGDDCRSPFTSNSYRCTTLWDRYAWHQAGARRTINPWDTRYISRFDYRRYFQSYDNLYRARCGDWPRDYRCHQSGWRVGWLDTYVPLEGRYYPSLYRIRVHQAWCAKRFRSYRISDNSFKPENGPRRRCQSPYAY